MEIGEPKKFHENVPQPQELPLPAPQELPTKKEEPVEQPA